MSIKKTVLFLILALSVYTPSGCKKQSTGSVEASENPKWQTVSIDPKDYGIVYEADTINELTGYPLDKLAAYYLGSDGAYAEGSSDELYSRFMEAPDIVINYVALIDDTESVKSLCEAIVNADVYWHDSRDDFKNILGKYSDTYTKGGAADVLSILKEKYYKAKQK